MKNQNQSTTLNQNSAFKNFDWDQYRSLGPSKKDRVNLSVKVQGRDKVYSHSPDAQSQYDAYINRVNHTRAKDFSSSGILSVSDIRISSKSTSDTPMVIVDFLEGLSHVVHLDKEKKFIEKVGFEDISEFLEYIQDPNKKESFLEQGLLAKVTGPERISLYEGALEQVTRALYEQAIKRTSAFNAHIESSNRGGYVVDVSGIKAFLPGSLASLTRIEDYESLVGTTLPVMIESYNEKTGFIVSARAYQEILAKEAVKDLACDDTLHLGRVTGIQPYGIFIEFGDNFSGLMHTSAMTSEMIDRKRSNYYEIGSDIEFYIKDNSNPTRVLLTDINPLSALLDKYSESQ